MPLIGEQAWWADAWTGASNSYTASWSFEMPPSAVFAKVSPAFYMEYSSNVGMMGVGITTIRRRKPDDSDETVDVGNVPAVWEPGMTSITYGMNLYNCQGRILCDLGFWE
jgi:hypothetical protein